MHCSTHTMPFLQTFTPLLTAATGGTLVWLLTQLANRYKSQKDDDRIRNEVIYYLLGLRHLLWALDTTPIKALMLDDIRKRLPPEFITPAFEENFSRQLSLAAMPLTKRLLDLKYPAVREGFARAVGKLSSVSPALAYELSGHEHALIAGGVVKEELTNALQEQGGTPENMAPVANRLENMAPDENFGQSRAAVDGLLEKIARKVSAKTRREVAQTIRAMDEKATRLPPEFDQLMALGTTA